MVPVPTKAGSVHICVNLTHQNKAVYREQYFLPSVGLGQFAGAQIFTKLDANKGFWQSPLSPQSAIYITFITPLGHLF